MLNLSYRAHKTSGFTKILPSKITVGGAILWNNIFWPWLYQNAVNLEPRGRQTFVQQLMFQLVKMWPMWWHLKPKMTQIRLNIFQKFELIKIKRFRDGSTQWSEKRGHVVQALLIDPDTWKLACTFSLGLLESAYSALCALFCHINSLL